MKIKKWKLIWRILVNKRNPTFGCNHNHWLACTLDYALRNYEDKRGVGAGDTLIYDLSYKHDIIIPGRRG